MSSSAISGCHWKKGHYKGEFYLSENPDSNTKRRERAPWPQLTFRDNSESTTKSVLQSPQQVLPQSLGKFKNTDHTPRRQMLLNLQRWQNCLHRWKGNQKLRTTL